VLPLSTPPLPLPRPVTPGAVLLELEIPHKNGDDDRNHNQYRSHHSQCISRVQSASHVLRHLIKIAGRLCRRCDKLWDVTSAVATHGCLSLDGLSAEGTLLTRPTSELPLLKLALVRRQEQDDDKAEWPEQETQDTAKKRTVAFR
jgi:hypothetical protein